MNIEKNITHFLHERHILKSTDTGNNYTCNGCYLPGRGARYRCNVCDFDLHFLCAKCPKDIPLPTAGKSHHHRGLTGVPSSSSSNNRMTLIPRPERWHDGTSLRRCDGCKERVEGLFYHMEGGNLDLHPVCFVKLVKESESGIQCQDRGLGSAFRKLWDLGFAALGLYSLYSDLSPFLGAFF